MQNSTKKQILSIILETAGSVILCTASLAIVLFLIAGLVFGSSGSGVTGLIENVTIIEAFDSWFGHKKTEAAQAASTVPKHFWIESDAEVPPLPDQTRFGQASSPDELQWLLQDAAPLLDGQETTFGPDTEILEGSVIHYYLDETILAITWKQVFSDFVYTISEIKIQDPSQFRRYIANGEYNSNKLYYTTQMSQMNNAVVASSADFYRNRSFGIVVYDREVRKITLPSHAETCFIDVNGDLLFTYRGELMDMESAQRYVDDNNVLFSLAFGPILIDNGQVVPVASYAIGEVHDPYPRAALCQKDKLHYLVVIATAEGKHNRYTDVNTFAKNLATLGCQKAYTLDGGRTATIAMNHQIINKVNYPEPRMTSDIIYFATALPNYSTTEE